MSSKKENEQIKNIRDTCLKNAESFLSVAEKQIGNSSVNHISYHLALLGLEEIGKSILATINHTNMLVGKEAPGIVNASDDHKKKIFWAIWGSGLLRGGEFKKEGIEKSRRLADTLHERRLGSLYTDANNPLPIDERIENWEAKSLVELTRARLELEKTQKLIDFKKEDIQVLAWFFNAVEDEESKKYIFGKVSLNKLEELKSGREWMKWLYSIFLKNKEEMRELAQKDLARKKPEGKEAEKPKYKMRVRIQTPSHSVRGNAFVKWNDSIDNIKMYKSGKKDVKKLAKGEILIDFTLPKGMHPLSLWEHGLFMSKTVVISLNVGTLGVFWWNVQKDVGKYYEYIQDLEADPKGGVKLAVAPPKRLHVNFDEARLVLNEKTMRNVNHMVAFFLREHKKIEEFLRSYAMGLTFFSKTDVHLRLEVNSFEEFYNALKAAMLAFEDWDGNNSTFEDAVKKQYEKIGEMNDLEKTLALGKTLEADVKREKQHPITLTEVIAMKIYCDYYMQLKGKEYFDKLDKNENTKNKS